MSAQIAGMWALALKTFLRTYGCLQTDTQESLIWQLKQAILKLSALELHFAHARF